MNDGNVSPGSLFLPSELRGAGARSLWPGWADRACFRPEGSCSLGCPPGAHVRAGAHGTGWGRRGDEAGLSSVLFPGASLPCCSRSRAPARGTAKGPRSRRTARTEAQLQVGGPRVGARAPREAVPPPSRHVGLHARAQCIRWVPRQRVSRCHGHGRRCLGAWGAAPARPLARPQGLRATSCSFLPNRLFFG